MRTGIILSAVVAVILGLAMLATAGWERPPMQSTQVGYRGLAMVSTENPRKLEVLAAANVAAEPIAPVPAGGPAASTVYKNVPALGHLGVGEFTRTMVAMTNWVAPAKESCNYCHVPTDLAADTLYTKVVSRRMVQMTQQINAEWKTHVGETGVTCYTCHRGAPVPAYVWFNEPAPVAAKGPAGNRAGQNAPVKLVGLTSLPNDPLATYLSQGTEIRVQGAKALPSGAGSSIQQTESTYGLMMHISGALGVNCTHCHNSRSFFEWDGSTPQRTTAWHGIRMVRELNGKFMEPLAGTFPPERLGPLGDGPKINCATCHQGIAKPLYGAAMAKEHPALTSAPAAK
jgi:photosynthetic reaction center cytochrome c subunit